jgi:hypothetical protein
MISSILAFSAASFNRCQLIGSFAQDLHPSSALNSSAKPINDYIIKIITT